MASRNGSSLPTLLEASLGFASFFDAWSNLPPNTSARRVAIGCALFGPGEALPCAFVNAPNWFDPLMPATPFTSYAVDFEAMLRNLGLEDASAELLDHLFDCRESVWRLRYDDDFWNSLENNPAQLALRQGGFMSRVEADREWLTAMIPKLGSQLANLDHSGDHLELPSWLEHQLSPWIQAEPARATA